MSRREDQLSHTELIDVYSAYQANVSDGSNKTNLI